MAVSLVVTGPPGAPVTQFAGLVAERHGLTLVVTDEVIAALAGKPVEEILIDDGEEHFRDVETQALRQVIGDSNSGSVIALGGGAVMVEANQQLLHGIPLVFVDATITEAARELGLNLTRTTTIVNPRAQWLRMLAERRPVYERLATVTVVADGTPLADLVDHVTHLF